MPGPRDSFLEEVLWHANAQAGAVAGQPVGINGAAVPDRLQRINRQFDNIAPRAPLHVGDQADAAGITLVARINQAGRAEGFEALAMGGFGPGLVCHSAAPGTRIRLSR